MSIFDWYANAKRSLEAELQLKITDDPSKVSGSCVFLDLPRFTNATLGAKTFEIDIWLVGGGPANLQSRDWLLSNVPAFLEAVGTKEAEPVPYKGEIPAYRTTLTFTLKD